MKLIPLSQGKFAKVDDRWFDYLSQFKWHYAAVGYAARRESIDKKRGRIIYMHHQIMGRHKGKYIDHINGDKLDDQIENLRVVSPTQSLWNIGKKKNSVTPYKGVYYDPRKKKRPWNARITYYGETIHLGCYPTALAAGLAYDLNAAALFGQYARLNFSDALVGMSVDASSSNPQSVDSHSVWSLKDQCGP